MSGHEDERMRLDRKHLLKAGAGGALVLAGVRPSLSSAALLAKPRQGGVAQIGVVPDINPSNIFRNDNANFSWWRLVFNTLTELDHKTGLPHPSLAESWKFSEGGKVVTLNLRSDVKFHSGRPFRPADVVNVIQTAKTPPWTHQFTAIINSIADASPHGAHGVQLRLTNPLSNLFDLFELLPMVDVETLKGVASGATIGGTGPFRFVQWKQGESVVMTKNPHYWKPGLPYLAGVNVRIIPQMQALVAALQSHQVDVIIDVNPASLAPLKGQGGFRVFESDVRGAGLIIASNVKIPPLDQKEVRQAIAWSIDRARIVQQVFYGVGVPDSVPWAPSNPAWSKAAANHYSYNIAKGKALLAQAGAAGLHVKLAVDSENPATAAPAQIAQFNLGQLGLNVDVVSFDNAQTETNEANGQMPGLFVDAHGLGHLHPATLVNGALFFRAGNASNFSTPEYTALQHESLVAATKAEQTKVYSALTNYLLDQQFVSDLVNYPRVLARQTRLVNYAYNINDFANLDSTYLT